MNERELLAGINKPIQNGLFQFGTFDKSFDEVNLLETKNLFGRFSPLFKKKLRLKEWQAFQIGNERFFMLVAIYNAKLLGIIQFLIYDKIKNVKYFYKKSVLPSKLSLPNSLKNSSALYNSDNLNISVNYSDKGKLKLTALSKNFANLPDFYAEFYADCNENTPQIVCIPFRENKGMYSQKSAITAEGKLIFDNECFDFKKSESFLILDDHKGYYPNPMIYDWCTGAKNTEGNIIAFNLTDNQSINPEQYNENCIWINNKINYLPPVKFYRPSGVNKLWIIKDDYGMINLSFNPLVDNSLKFNFGIIKTDYFGPFGSFNGLIKLQNLSEINLDNFFGMGEKKYVKG
jgi:hypothetical protein